jgi:hypothetical protein
VADRLTCMGRIDSLEALVSEVRTGARVKYLHF